MIGVNITLKDGILIFSHFFVPGFSDVDEDLRAGLMTAVLNAVKETDKNLSSGPGIKTIDQGKYFVHIAEGKYTYGLFFSHENDLKEHDFANAVIDDFETKFHDKLDSKFTEFDDSDFESFTKELTKRYNQLISIDVVGLSKVIELMEGSLFDDYIILEKPHLHQVFTTISIPEIYPHASFLALMCKTMLEAGIKIKKEISHLSFNLGDSFFVFVERLGKYVIILIIRESLREEARKEIVLLKSKFYSKL
ncbi:MAG: hypothetical protein ACTSW1_14435 [Candidatus Hodarchaeales archaeon]